MLCAAPLLAQHPAELDREAKTGIFVEHLVKVARVDPARFRALVIEYETGQALREMELLARDAGHEHLDGQTCAHAACAHERDFIASALSELEPRYAEALGRAQDDPEGAAALLRRIAAENTGSAGANPYLRAYARWQLAELDFRAARAARAADPAAADARLDAVLATCEEINRTERLYLIPDHRVCELIALAFAELSRPLLEATQYALLLTDYQDLPPAVEQRARARLEALADHARRPLASVAGWMDSVEQLISAEVTAPDPTQVKEEKILVALDKLIELQEARERQTCNNCGSLG